MLDKLFNPKSVAIIGAAREEGKVGHVILENIINAGFKGDIFAVNPKAKQIHDIKSYPSILDIEKEVDLAVIVTPAKTIPSIVEELGRKGVTNAIIISAGFKETGIEGSKLENQTLEIAKKHDIRLLGPNCLGLVNTKIGLNASFMRTSPLEGNIAFVSQSGALQTAILDWSREINLGFSKFVSLGNKSDLNENDFIEALVKDKNTSVICLYLEGVSDGSHFLKISEEFVKKKPIIALKAGRTDAGARAVSSHTGTLAGSNRAYTAAFTQSGIIQASSLRELFYFALALSSQPLPKSNSLGILTNAGGPAILASDWASSAALTVASLTNKTIKSLSSFLPAAASLYNPVDLLGDAKEDRYKKALSVMLKDSNIDSLLAILTPQAMTEIEKTAKIISEVSKNNTKPVVASFMGGPDIKKAEKILKQYNIPNYIYPEDAVKSIGALVTYSRILQRPKNIYKKYKVNKKTVRDIIKKSASEQRVNLSYMEANEILKAYGIDIPQSHLAKTTSEAKKLAENISFPVALKIVSEDILHKTDIGGVKIGINNKKQVLEKFENIIANAKRYMPQARVEGVLVQKMVEGGLETIVGISRDPQFGPLVLFGLGGIYVEILKDVSFRIAPLSTMDVKKMVGEVKSYLLLKEIRGRKARDIEAIEEAILRISQLVTDFEEIVEMDINPLIAREENRGAIAADVRMSISIK
ncbi:MAG: CoA-binding protein [Actinobacteria bacterium]|nr:MAG: CoA-binding protein [Actinomycetota bacterium]